MNWLQPWHLIILVIALIVLFGAKRLPDAARSIGKSMKIFKAETRGLKDDASQNSADNAGATPSASTDAPKQITSDSEQDRIEKLQRELETLKAQQQQRSSEHTTGPSSSTAHDSTK